MFWKKSKKPTPKKTVAKAKSAPKPKLAIAPKKKKTTVQRMRTAEGWRRMMTKKKSGK